MVEMMVLTLDAQVVVHWACQLADVMVAQMDARQVVMKVSMKAAQWVEMKDDHEVAHLGALTVGCLVCKAAGQRVVTMAGD
jgi:hypothetical protein